MARGNERREFWRPTETDFLLVTGNTFIWRVKTDGLISGLQSPKFMIADYSFLLKLQKKVRINLSMTEKGKWPVLTSFQENSWGFYLYVCAGPNDDSLPWPISMKYALKAFNPSKNSGHIDYNFIDDKHWGKPDGTSTGWGYPDFLPFSRVEEFTDSSRFIAFAVTINMKKPWLF